MVEYYTIILGMRMVKKRPYEVDFLVSDNNKIIPIEVKSSNQLMSLLRNTLQLFQEESYFHKKI